MDIEIYYSDLTEKAKKGLLEATGFKNEEDFFKNTNYDSLPIAIGYIEKSGEK